MSRTSHLLNSPIGKATESIYESAYKTSVDQWKKGKINVPWTAAVKEPSTQRKWYMFWRRNKKLENKVFQLEAKVNYLADDLQHEMERVTRLTKIVYLVPSSPNNGFFMVYEHDKTEEKEKEWITKGWHLKDKFEQLELWVKD